MQKVTITFKGGKATIKTEGFKGGACKSETRELKEALGIVTKDTPTPDLYEAAQTQRTSGTGN